MQFMADNGHLIYVNDSKLQGFEYQMWPQDDYYCKNYQLIHVNTLFVDPEHVNEAHEDIEDMVDVLRIQ